MKLWKITFWALFITIILCVWIFVIGISADRPGSFYNRGNNAVWIEHKWVGEAIGEEDIAKLITKLQENDIGTVFVHTGPLKSDGTIDTETYKYAERFLEKARKYDKNIQFQSWLGQIRSSIDLSDPYVRQNVVKQAQILSQMVGFDGIHFDIEPVWDGDLDFISLLKETREVLDGKKMSVALAEFIPNYAIWTIGRFYNFENYNTEYNYENVAKYADQIVTMVYDTGIDSGFLYSWLVREQVIWITNLFDDKEVFIAIPAYEEIKDGFNPEVENLKNGLTGILKGLNNIRSNEENFAGVAIYPYWEMDETEWKIYNELWIQ